MSARKLGHVAGLVLVLVAVFGVTGVELPPGDGATAVQESTETVDWL
jgi:hypothetical protein